MISFRLAQLPTHRGIQNLAYPLPDDAGIAPADHLMAHGSDPLDRLLEFERGEVLAAAVAQLPVIHREILTAFRRGDEAGQKSLKWRTLTVILAGGRGERLYPLTRERAKPAVPLGGDHRIIDFTLSNCLNSNLRRIYILTQYKPESLRSLVQRRWRRSIKANEFMCCLPPSEGKRYMGTGDAVYQNIGLIRKTGAESSKPAAKSSARTVQRNCWVPSQRHSLRASGPSGSSEEPGPDSATDRWTAPVTVRFAVRADNVCEVLS